MCLDVATVPLRGERYTTKGTKTAIVAGGRCVFGGVGIWFDEPDQVELA